MELFVVEVDKNNNDTWTLFGIFSSEELANKNLMDNNIPPNCSLTTRIKVDELV